MGSSEMTSTLVVGLLIGPPATTIAHGSNNEVCAVCMANLTAFRLPVLRGIGCGAGAGGEHALKLCFLTGATMGPPLANPRAISGLILKFPVDAS